MSGSLWVNPPTKPSPGKGVFVVQRLSWTVMQDESGPVFYRNEGDQGTPLCCFRDRERAEAYCRELQRQARRELSPFRFIQELEFLEDLTSLSEKALCQGLRKLGLKPPTVRTFPTKWKTINWWAWWDAVAGDLSDAQREGIYELLDRLHFYEVVEAELDPS
jgi:hypothetical protein